MESDEEDAFCYRSLKRIRTNQEKADQHKTRADHHHVKSKIKTSKVEKNTKRKSNRKSAELSSNKITVNVSESEKPTQLELESEATDVLHYNSSNNENTFDRVTKETHKSVKNSTVEVQCLGESIKRTKKHQHKPDTSETILGDSVSDQVLPKSNSATHKPTEKHCQKTSMDDSDSDSTSSFQNKESYMTTIYDVCPKQDANQDIQTEPNVSKETSHTSDLSEDKNGLAASKVVQEKMATVFEEGRCPFCQMPFQALSGQSPNWHTMECMDVPLKTAQECPVGLTCDSTVPSHYRRYGHSQVALHLAGQGQQEGCASPGGQHSQGLGHSSANVETVSPLRAKLGGTAATTRASPQQKQQSQTKSKSRKRKQSSSKSKPEGSASGLSLSQGSQGSTGSNSSIKAYFSPSGKKPASCARDACSQNCQDGGSEIMSDRVPRVLVLSDSDSDESVDNNDERFQNETDEDEMDVGVGKSSHQYDGKHPTETLPELGSPVVENLGDGFILQEPDDQEAFPDSRDVVVTHVQNAVHSDTETKTRESLQILADNEPEGQSGLHLSHFTSTTVARTSSAPTGPQKQTSLFSFFKPHCHSANVSKHGAPKGAAAVSPEPSGSERNQRSSVQTGRKPVLIKSTSEPVKTMRVPSPPPSTVGGTNTRRQASQRGRASGAASSSFRNSSRRQCPFYKKLSGTSITVDAFSYGEIPGCQAYVLTHFHYDHYQGLTKKFSQPIYCSQVTGNLVQRQLGISEHQVHTLPLNQPRQVAGVWLTLMEANHCPGAVIILFELPDGRKLLHTGDFRADPGMEQYPPLVGVSVDELYLDTTYCDPSHAFPSQGEAIEFAVSTALKAVERAPRTLIVCGAYTIGKERVFMAIAEALQTKVCVQSAKKRVLDCLEDDRLKKLVSVKWAEGRVHVLPMRQLNAKALSEHLRQCPQFSSVLAFEPTGWTHSNKTLSLAHLRPKFSSTGITVYGVPYSEHSSYLEMKRFVQFVRPKKILPTVNNGNPTSRGKMEAIFRQWLSEETPKGKKQASANGTTQPSLGAWLGKPS